MKFFAIFFIFLIGSANATCFDVHLADAIKINKKRSELYAKETDGKSKNLSRELMLMERLTRPIAKIYDRRDAKYAELGISFFCDALIDMKETPKFQSSKGPRKAPTLILAKDEVKELSDKVEKLVRRGDWNQTDYLLDKFLHSKTLDNPHYFCLTRHFVESLLRATRLRESHREAARSYGAKDSNELIKDFFILHLRGLLWSYRLDMKALPLQQAGSNLFCQDVPAIPVNL
jgi:hypothetical protein